MNHSGDANKMVGEDHIRDARKMVSDTPMTDSELVEMITGDGPVKTITKWVHSSVCFQLERKLNAANQRIKRLEREVELLRLYGNKDCTAQADEVLKKEAKP